MFGYGVAVGLTVGLVLGVAGALLLLRHGMVWYERLHTGFKEGVPVFAPYDTPLEQCSTDGTTDLEVEP